MINHSSLPIRHSCVAEKHSDIVYKLIICVNEISVWFLLNEIFTIERKCKKKKIENNRSIFDVHLIYL